MWASGLGRLSIDLLQGCHWRIGWLGMRRTGATLEHCQKWILLFLLGEWDWLFCGHRTTNTQQTLQLCSRIRCSLCINRYLRQVIGRSMATVEIGQKLSGVLFLYRLFWKGRSLVLREGPHPSCIVVRLIFFHISLSSDRKRR
jgi:hypothetical protein